MKYGLLKYSESNQFFNVGDYIQSLAAKQYLPNVDALINREKMAAYEGDKIKLILNGWFTHNPENWIPSKGIVPLFVSFHINNTAAPYMLNENGVQYLKQHQPIGCRDQYTTDILKEKGIDAYFTGCLTLTLDSYKVDDSEKDDKIYIVDPLYGYITKKKVFRNWKTFLLNIYNGRIFNLGKREKHLRNFISDDVLNKAIYINQELPANTYTEDEKFQIAEELLNKYARAKLVITSRIHCALPCLAMGTPVIYINGFESFVDSCRFEGIINLFNRIDIDEKTGKYSSNFNLEGKITNDTKIINIKDYKVLGEKMKEKCSFFIGTNNI